MNTSTKPTKPSLPQIGQRIQFDNCGGLTGIKAVVVSRCPRHRSVVAQVTDGNRWYRFGHLLHVVAGQAFHVTG